MECDEIRPLLSGYIDGVLSGAEQQAVELHLTACRTCAGELAELQQTVSRIRSLESPEPPPWLAAKVMARIRDEKAKKSFFRRHFYPPHIKLPLQAAAAAAVALLTFSVFRGIQPDLRMESAPLQMSSPVEEEHKAPDRPAALPEGKEARLKSRPKSEADAGQPLHKKSSSVPAAPAPAEGSRIKTGEPAKTQVDERPFAAVPEASLERTAHEERFRSSAAREEKLLDSAVREGVEAREKTRAVPGRSELRQERGAKLIFSDPVITADIPAKVREVRVAVETGQSLVLDIDYYLSEGFEGDAAIAFSTDIPGLKTVEMDAQPGRNQARMAVTMLPGSGDAERTSERLVIVISGIGPNGERSELARNIIAYRKTWRISGR